MENGFKLGGNLTIRGRLLETASEVDNRYLTIDAGLKSAATGLIATYHGCVWGAKTQGQKLETKNILSSYMIMTQR